VKLFYEIYVSYYESKLYQNAAEVMEQIKRLVLKSNILFSVAFLLFKQRKERI